MVNLIDLLCPCCGSYWYQDGISKFAKCPMGVTLILGSAKLSDFVDSWASKEQKLWALLEVNKFNKIK